MSLSRKSFAFLSVLVIGLFLVGCAPVYQTNYSYIPPKSWKGKQCVNRCLSNRSICRSVCRSATQSCRNTANLEAMPAYLQYVAEQKNQNQPLLRTVSDFADYSNCSDHCGCESTYRECYANCGGQVMADTQCVAFCKKPGQ